MTYQDTRRYQLANLANGRCRCCPRKRADGNKSHCKLHAALHAQQERKRRKGIRNEG